MDRGLFFLLMSLVLFYLVLDDLFGNKKYISKMVSAMIPSFPSLNDMVNAESLKENNKAQDIKKKNQQTIDKSKLNPVEKSDLTQFNQHFWGAGPN